MPNPGTPAPITNPADTGTPSLIKEAGGTGTILDQATDEQKQAQAAENTRLLEAEDEDLSPEDKTKKDVLVKGREDERLLNADDKDLSPEEKTKKDELVKAKEAAAKGQQIPEKYEFKIPEGMTLDQALVDKISPIFRELKISQEGAQKLTEVYAENIKAIADTQAESFKKFLKDSYEETIKGLGANYKEQLMYVAKVRDRFLSEESRALLDASGMSNNKAFISDLIKLGKLISEDKSVSGISAAPEGATDAAHTLYPNQGK